VHLRYIGRKKIVLKIYVPVEARTPERIAAGYPLLVQAKKSAEIGAAHERKEAELDAMRLRLADLVQKAGGFLITEEEEEA